MLLQSLDFSAKNFVSETAAERNDGQRFRFDVNSGACLLSMNVQPHREDWRGDWWLVLEHEVLSKASATWHLSSLILTSLASLFSCTSCRLPFFFPSALSGSISSLFDSFCTPGMTLPSLPSYLLLLFLSNTSFLCDSLDCQCYWF